VCEESFLRPNEAGERRRLAVRSTGWFDGSPMGSWFQNTDRDGSKYDQWCYQTKEFADLINPLEDGIQTTISQDAVVVRNTSDSLNIPGLVSTNWVMKGDEEKQPKQTSNKNRLLRAAHLVYKSIR